MHTFITETKQRVTPGKNAGTKCNKILKDSPDGNHDKGITKDRGVEQKDLRILVE
jgi:hypothetical protein